MDLKEFYLGKYDLITELNGEQYYMCVFPEMLPNFPTLIKPTGGYFICCVHPQYGSCSFTVTQNEECRWICEVKPPWIQPNLVQWIGEQIESYTR